LGLAVPSAVQTDESGRCDRPGAFESQASPQSWTTPSLTTRLRALSELRGAGRVSGEGLPASHPEFDGLGAAAEGLSGSDMGTRGQTVERGALLGQCFAAQQFVKNLSYRIGSAGTVLHSFVNQFLSSIAGLSEASW